MGDGGFQMNMQELGTIIAEKLPIRIVLFNNGYLGMVRQWRTFFITTSRFCGYSADRRIEI